MAVRRDRIAAGRPPKTIQLIGFLAACSASSVPMPKQIPISTIAPPGQIHMVAALRAALMTPTAAPITAAAVPPQMMANAHHRLVSLGLSPAESVAMIRNGDMVSAAPAATRASSERTTVAIVSVRVCPFRA